MADSVGRLVGVRPDYVFTTGFLGLPGRWSARSAA